MKKITKNGFTLVELLAVIVILAIILVIAVPKVMSVIEDSKKATLESTAKMIASAAEKQKVQNTVLGNTEEITCDSVAKINNGDYANCDIEFDDNIAKVTIEGKGKFDGLWVCNGTKNSAISTEENCRLRVLTLNLDGGTNGNVQYNAKYEVGTTITLIEPTKEGYTFKEWTVSGTGASIEDNILIMGTENTTVTAIWEEVINLEEIYISSPNWPEGYLNNMTEEENYWEATYKGADSIQITFDSASKTESVSCDYIVLYDEDGKEIYRLGGTDFAGQTYTIMGEYMKITMVSDNNVTYPGFSALIKPVYNS